MNLREIAAFALDEVGYAEDASFFDGFKRFMVNQPGKRKDKTLADHDKQFHPNGYNQGDRCKYRDELKKGDSSDDIGNTGNENNESDASLPKGVSVDICDITKEESDAIVNAANRWMLGGGGVDGAIHRAAGPRLVEECRKYPADANGYRVQTGDAKITDGCDLKAKYVIHTAGPDIRDEEAKNDPENNGELLRSSYRKSLELAKKFGAKSVSFPSISTGIFGYPLDKASQYASEEITEFLKKNPDMSVKMCIYDPFDSERIASSYREAFKKANSGNAEMVGSSVEDELPEVRNLRHLLRTNAISKKDFASGIAALAAVGKLSKGRVGLIKRQMMVEDEDINQPQTDLEKHDAKYHGGHYDGKSSCKYRDDLAKGDNVDNLNPEDVDGEEIEGSKSEVAGKKDGDAKKSEATLAKDVADAKDDLDKTLQNPSSIKDITDALDKYEGAYNAATGGSVVSAFNKLLSKVNKKNPTGVVSRILQKHLSLHRSSGASANLPNGTLTPEEARNQAALAIAKMLGANLTVPKAETPSTLSEQPNVSPSVPEAPQPQQPIQNGQPVSQSPAQVKYGPNDPLDISASGFPTAQEFNFGTYGQQAQGWKGGSGGSTDPHSIVIKGQKYWVKKAGNNSSYSDAAAENEVNANKFIRLAGFNAPESKLYTENGVNYCVTKDTPFVGTASASNSSTQMREVYPLMALLYSTDAMMNGNTKRDSNGLVLLDNGSSFGFSAQGNRPNPNIDWDYDARTEADSTVNKDSGIMALLEHPSQHEWRNAYGSPTQDDVLKEAAKYDMGALVKEAAKRGLLSHLPTIGQTSLQAFADSLDNIAGKYKSSSSTTATQNNQTQAQQPQSAQSQNNAGGNQINWANAVQSASVPNLYVDASVPSSFLKAFHRAANNRHILGPLHNYGLSAVPSQNGTGTTGEYVVQYLGPSATAQISSGFQSPYIQYLGPSATTLKAIGFQNPHIAAANLPSVSGYKKIFRNNEVVYVPNAKANSSTGNTASSNSGVGATQASAPSSNTQNNTPHHTPITVTSSKWTMPTGPISFNASNPQHNAVHQQANSSWKQVGQNAPKNQLRNSQAIIAAIATAGGAPANILTPAANRALASIIRNGTFTANGRGIGGTVTGINLPRKGIQGVQKSINSILNPQGLVMKVHNNGNITFAATNRAIAKAALSAASQTTQQQPSSTPSVQAQQSAPQTNSTISGNKPWQKHLSNLQAGLNGNNQNLNNAYNNIATWLNNAGV